MRIAVLLIAFLVVLFLRRLYLRFTAPIRQAKRERAERVLGVIAQSSGFSGQPARSLFDALGPENSSASLDFGLVVHDWHVGQIVVRAYIRNDLCESLEMYERGRLE